MKTTKRTTKNDDARRANKRAREIVTRVTTRYMSIDDATRVYDNARAITRNDDYNARRDIVRCDNCDALIVDDVTCMNCAHVRDASRIVDMLIANDAKRVHTFE